MIKTNNININPFLFYFRLSTIVLLYFKYEKKINNKRIGES